MGIPSRFSHFTAVASFLFLGCSALVVACGDDDDSGSTNNNTTTGTADAGKDTGTTTTPTSGDDAGPDAEIPTTDTTSYTVGGSVTGLATGTSVVLQNNGGDNFTANANGTFNFTTPVANNGAYEVKVFTQPAAQHCTVTSGSGTVSGQTVTNVAVACAPAFTVGGDVVGATGTGLSLKNTYADGTSETYAVTDDTFTFPTALLDKATFTVSVVSSPTEQTCTVTSGNGAQAIDGENFTGLEITCTTNTYTVGGTVSGLLLDGETLSLVNNANAAKDALKSANASFTFEGTLTKGSAYDVEIAPLAAGSKTQACTLSANTGTMGSANVTNITNTCSQTVFCGATDESNNLTLSCPQGQVIKSVDFADYGNSGGTCGNLVTGLDKDGKASCSVDQTKFPSVMACINQQTCMFQTGNGFPNGDPCSGTVKHLSAQITCQTNQ